MFHLVDSSRDGGDSYFLPLAPLLLIGLAGIHQEQPAPRLDWGAAQNPGFEVVEGGFPVGWTVEADSAPVDSSGAFAGSRCLRLGSDAATAVQCPFSATGVRKLRISFMARTSGSTRQDLVLRVAWNGPDASQRRVRLRVQADGRWHRLASLVPLPANATGGVVALSLPRGDPGPYWVDCFAISAV